MRLFYVIPPIWPLFLAITIAISIWLICGNGKMRWDEPKEMANAREELNEIEKAFHTTSKLYLNIQQGAWQS